jgi:hypothetical protein
MDWEGLILKVACALYVGGFWFWVYHVWQSIR